MMAAMASWSDASAVGHQGPDDPETIGLRDAEGIDVDACSSIAWAKAAKRPGLFSVNIETC